MRLVLRRTFRPSSFVVVVVVVVVACARVLSFSDLRRRRRRRRHCRRRRHYRRLTTKHDLTRARALACSGCVDACAQRRAARAAGGASQRLILPNLARVPNSPLVQVPVKANRYTLGGGGAAAWISGERASERTNERTRERLEQRARALERVLPVDARKPPSFLAAAPSALFAVASARPPPARRWRALGCGSQGQASAGLARRLGRVGLARCARRLACRPPSRPSAFARLYRRRSMASASVVATSASHRRQPLLCR